MSLSIIIPALNEAGSIRQTLTGLRELEWPMELIVVDGGSTDSTIGLAQPLADKILESPPGRALQMNAGARVAAGEYLMFLHADTMIPRQASTQLQAALENKPIWGRFDVRIDGSSKMLGIVAIMMNVRSRISGIATGDQAIVVRRDVFEAIGGFVQQPLMEDIELSKQLLKHSRPICLNGPVITSGRRWDKQGTWRTIVLMWRLRWRYWRGESADQLAKEYRS